MHPDFFAIPKACTPEPRGAAAAAFTVDLQVAEDHNRLSDLRGLHAQAPVQIFKSSNTELITRLNTHTHTHTHKEALGQPGKEILPDLTATPSSRLSFSNQVLMGNSKSKATEHTRVRCTCRPYGWGKC